MPTSEAVRRTIFRLLDARSHEATICPSEVARALVIAGQAADWRPLMQEVHLAVDQMLYEGEIELSWKGQAMKDRAGPYRIARASRSPKEAE